MLLKQEIGRYDDVTTKKMIRDGTRSEQHHVTAGFLMHDIEQDERI